MKFFNFIKKLNQLKHNQKDLNKTADIVVFDADGTESKVCHPASLSPELENVQNYIHSVTFVLEAGNFFESFTKLEQGLNCSMYTDSLTKLFFTRYLNADTLNLTCLVLEQQFAKFPRIREILYKYNGNYSDHFEKFVDYCLEENFSKLLEQIIYDDSALPRLLWQLSDILLIRQHKELAHVIYGRLSKQTLAKVEDYLYVGLSEYRLGNAQNGITHLENGLKIYPDDKILGDVYIEICVEQHNYKRYSEFMQKLLGSDDSVLSVIDFYKKIFTSNAQQNLLINFKDIERNCIPSDFELLKQHFLAALAENHVSLHSANHILFFGKYFDIDNDFCLAVFEILKKSFRNFNEDSKKVMYSFEILLSLTIPIIPPSARDLNKTILKFIDACKLLAADSTTLTEPLSDLLHHWAPWQSVFCSAVLAQYPHAMSAFEQFAFATWPKLNYTSPHIIERLQAPGQTNRKIKIGFTVLDSMPMMAGLLRQFDKNVFDTVYLHPGKIGSSQIAKSWMASADKIVEYSNVDSLSAIKTIAAQQLDIIVSGPSVPSIFFPMMARLAPLQMVLLEPNWMNGTKNTDYYISWRPAEPIKPKDFYQSAVAYLEHPPYWIEQPSLDVNMAVSQEARDGIRKRLLDCGPEKHVYLCANTPPKIHPIMDEVFADLLAADPKAIIVMLRGDYAPLQSLKIRLQEKLGYNFDRVIFLPTLLQEDAHSLLMSADCCLDSFPLCGMSSSFDAAMLGVPLVTLPYDIPFGRWTAAIYDYIGVSGLTARSQEDYVQLALRVASDVSWRAQKALEIKEKASLYIESRVAFEDLQKFIIEAWNRKLLGLSPANWIAEAWQENIT